MISEDFFIPVEDEMLAVTIDWAIDKSPPSILSLHGAGTSCRKRIAYLTEMLATCGHSCLRFDYSGHGDSSGQLNQASLAKRVKEVEQVIHHYVPNRPLTLIATSMSGHVALEILKNKNIENLILFCPAAYSDEAYDLPFTAEFTNAIRKEIDFSAVKIFDHLNQFDGNFLHIIGDQDQVIPPQVTDAYKQYTSHLKNRDFIVYKGAPHKLHDWLPLQTEHTEKLITKIISVIEKDHHA